MNKTFGQLLDNPHEWFWHINHTLASVTLLRLLQESELLAHIGSEPASFEDVSTACGIPASHLKRICYFLAAEDLLEMKEGSVAHTSRSRQLQSLMSVIGTAMHAVDAGAPMTEALRKGKTPYELRYGKPAFEYLGEHPETAQLFVGFMSFLNTLVSDFVFRQHTFKSFELAVDVGGSHGELLLNLLSHHPEARGVLFDLPEVTAMVADSVRGSQHGKRVEIVGGDFFNAVPAGDLYLLKMILHDWNDEQCVQILKGIRHATLEGGRVAVIEYVMPDTPRPHPANAMDIAMLIWVTGRERNLAEFGALFDAAGFRLDRVSENPLGQSVIEAVAV